MNESYVRVPREEAKRMAEQTIAVVKFQRDKRWERAIADYKWWGWLLRWRRNMSDIACKAAMSGSTIAIEIHLLYWRQEDRSKAVGHLCKLAGSDPYVYLCAADAERIEFGDLMSNV